MWWKLLGGILIIVGVCIGGGILALPLVTAAGGFFNSLGLLFVIWLLTVFTAFLILEVNLWFPEGSNMISMAKATLGIPGQFITWGIYLIFLYAALAAYIAGGSDLMGQLMAYCFHFNSPDWFNTILFLLIFGGIVHLGIRIVDFANRGLMTLKFIACILLILFTVPYIQMQKLEGGDFHLLGGAVMVVVISFCYAVVIPSLRTYFNSDIKALRWAIIIGTLIPLIFYILWDMAAQGNIAAKDLSAIADSKHTISDLTHALSMSVNSSVVYSAAHVFTIICVTTSFLGIALSLADFVADGFRIRKQGKGRWIVSGITLLPPLLIVLFYPSAFLIALKYAGLFAVMLVMLLPGLMAWSGRYVKRIAPVGGYQVWGGSWLLGLEILCAVGLLIYGLIEVWP